jgi:hypothetical protein
MRERLPNRRAATVFDFEHDGRRFTAAVSRFGDGRMAEVFLNSGKDSAVAQLAQEAAILASIALQFGADVETIRHAISSTAAGPLAVALDLIDEAAQ